MRAGSDRRAMDGDESGGRAPVVIVRPTTNVTSGVAVTQKLVRAAVAFGDLIRGTFGPNGLDKMLYKSNGETAVTNDGARIVSDLMVKHPAAKTFVSMAETQENACGDGVTGCLIFAAELMREGGRLLERSLHPLTLVEGYREAADITLATAEARSQDATEADAARWIDVALTAMTGTSAEAGGVDLASLVVDAAMLVQRTAGTDPLSYERIRMAKRGSGDLGQSRLISGLILDQRLALDRQARLLNDVKVAVLTRPLTLQKGVRDTEIEVNDVDQLESFMAAEDALLDAHATSVINSGARLIVCAKEVEPRVLHRLVDAGCVVLADVGRDGADDLADVTGATLCEHLDDLDAGALGHLDRFSVETLEGEDGRRERLMFEHANSKLACIDVAGSAGTATEEVIRGLFDALRSVIGGMDSGRLLLGGGSLHVAAASAVREAAEASSGRRRLAMEAYARALEAVPGALIENAGGNRLDVLMDLRAAHRAGHADEGVTPAGINGTITQAWANAETLEHAVVVSTEAVCGLLRIDQVISARGD
ncbi:MAG: hypothetical protein CBD01_001860 [Euryarchaeota archaeon TMED141]|nr:MAG: hypothetical protein CBD01_001860 [Euryarchaeota archaeon TMED141]DAC18243.1 MAG TPA: hypothetical protein D7I01_02275 [Candidatus Poseidoniales archaeon]